MGKLIRRKLMPLVATLLLGITTVWLPGIRVSALESQDCDDNAVIRCGAQTEAEFRTKYRENQQGNVQSLYRTFNIPDEASLTGLVEGSVDTSNNVYVGTRLVGRNAITAGRQNMSNSRGSSTPILGGAFYQRPPSVSFANPNGSLRALVKMDNDVFRFAVLTSCGNPVKADAVQPVATKIVTPTIVRTHPNFTINKYVRSERDHLWQLDISAKQGETVQFKIAIQNTGDTTLDDITVHDDVPVGLLVDTSSLQIGSGSSGDVFSDSGLTIRSLPVNQTYELVFDATVASDAKACVAKRLVNSASASSDTVTERRAGAKVQVCPAVVKKVTVAKDTPTPATLVNTGPSHQLFMGFMIASFLGTSLRYLVGFYQQRLQRFGL